MLRVGCPDALRRAPRLVQHQSDACQSAIGASDALGGVHPGAKADVYQGLPGAGAEKSVVPAPACPAWHVPAQQHPRQRLGAVQELCTRVAARSAEQSFVAPLAADAAGLLELQLAPAVPAQLGPARRVQLVLLGLRPASAAERLALVESVALQLAGVERAR